MTVSSIVLLYSLSPVPYISSTVFVTAAIPPIHIFTVKLPIDAIPFTATTKAPIQSTTPSFTPLKFPRFDFANPSSSPSGKPSLLPQQPPSQEQSSNPRSTTLELASTSQPFKFPSTSSQPLSQSQSSNSLPSFSKAAAGFTFQPTTPIPSNTSTQSKEQLQLPAPPSVSATPPTKAFNFAPAKSPPGSAVASAEKQILERKSLSTLSTTPKGPPPLRKTNSPSPVSHNTSPDSGFSKKDKDRLIDDFARVALLRPNGLIQNYIEYNLPDIVRAVFIQHHRDIHNAAVGE